MAAVPVPADLNVERGPDVPGSRAASPGTPAQTQ